MSEHNEKGKLAEDLALEFLVAKGYDILEKNWRTRKAEIDLIAKHNGSLIFIEVKSRKNADFGDPAIKVNARKKALLFSAASQYMEQINYEWTIRFDIITIILRDKNSFEVEHYVDAFFPGL